jgi:hypothetical protein
MTPRRRWLVSGLLSVMTAGHLYDVATGREHWPFSPYPMYSHAAHEWAMVLPRVVGVRSDGDDAELPLWEPRYLDPFDQSRLLQALQALLERPDGRTPVGLALADCLARYERRRAAGEHDGPALRALRYYHVHWTLEPDAGNVDRPDQQTLVLEVALPGSRS